MKKFHNSGFGKIFWIGSQKQRKQKTKIDKCYCTKLKNLLPNKEIPIMRQPMNYEKIFATYVWIKYIRNSTH